jgi:hypothetical protein
MGVSIEPWAPGRSCIHPFDYSILPYISFLSPDPTGMPTGLLQYSLFVFPPPGQPSSSSLPEIDDFGHCVTDSLKILVAIMITYCNDTGT